MSFPQDKRGVLFSFSLFLTFPISAEYHLKVFTGVKFVALFKR